MKRIPTLDGWRGIAIAMVIFDHAQATLIRGYLRPWTQTGNHGVTVFFVLSGFLITTNLLESPINLRRFYLRRFFRLMPVAWLYVFAVWGFGLMGNQHWFSFSEIASCLFFYRNFFGPGSTLFVAHFWSLSLEEQFYIVWPSLLLLAGIRNAKWLAVGGALACATYRLMNWGHYDHIWLSFETQVRADALLVGCLTALLLKNQTFRSTATRWSKVWAFPALAVFLFCIYCFHWLPPLTECVAIAGVISASVLHSQSIFARLLSFPALAWLGTVSYSVYVWQQFFFVYRGETLSIVMMCLMPLFALCSYYLIERPYTRFGHRLTDAPSPKISVATAAVVVDTGEKLE
jgi:peptidoglycan/LPS O-acetylase OafA/YrhL